MPDQEPEEAAVRPETALGKQLVADQVTHLKKVLADQVTHPKKVLADQVKTTQVKVPAVHQVIVPGKTMQEAQAVSVVAVQAVHREEALAVRVEAVLAVHPVARPVSHLRIRPYRMILKKRKILPDR